MNVKNIRCFGGVPSNIPLWLPSSTVEVPTKVRGLLEASVVFSLWSAAPTDLHIIFYYKPVERIN